MRPSIPPRPQPPARSTWAWTRATSTIPSRWATSIYLGATPGLKAGVYTLLPARYALLPGAFLVTPQTTASVGTYALTSGSIISNGYQFNGLDQSTANPQLEKTVTVSSSKVFLQDAPTLHSFYSANEFIFATPSHKSSGAERRNAACLPG